MMDKPAMKREVAIRDVLPITKTLYFFASQDALSDLEEFGMIRRLPVLGNNVYELLVDPRFDFDEVVRWIEEYGGK
jgi:hypothetical protein